MEKCWIILFLFVLMKVADSFKFNYTCEGQLNISCGAKPIILISVMSVTRQHWACSLAGSGDRNNRKEAAVWRKCSGKTSCTIKSGMKLGDYKYLGIHYDCGKSYDMCSSVRIESNKAYLESPNYRNVFPYASSTVCRCKAELAKPTRLVVGVQYKLFSSIDTHLMIKWRPDETVQIYEETDLSPGVIYRETANETFVIMFNANGRNGTGFFQLFYKASNPITMVCNMDMPTMIPTTQVVTASIQIPHNSTPIADDLTTIPLEETTMATIITSTTTETSTDEPTVTTELIQTTRELTTTMTTSAKIGKVNETRVDATSSRKEIPVIPPVASTISTTSDGGQNRSWTEAPVVARVMNRDHNMKVLGVLVPVLIGLSVLVAVTCFFTLLALFIISRLKRKKEYPRRASYGNHVVSRSVYELEHPVPGKEESDQQGNGVIEDSAPPSVDVVTEDLKLKDERSGKGSVGCNSLSGKWTDSDLNGTESSLLHNNVLYQVMDEIDEVAPGSPSLYATIDRGRKMWIEPPERRDSDDASQGLVTLENGPSLTFDKGHGEPHSDSNDDVVEECTAEPQSQGLNDGQPMTLEEGKSVTFEDDGKRMTLNDDQGHSDSERPTEVHLYENSKMKAEEEKSPVDMDSILDLFSHIPHYAVVNKVKQEPARAVAATSSASSDTASEDSGLVFGNGHSNDEPDYADIPGDISCPKDTVEASSEALVLPDGAGEGENHGAYMSVDVTNLWTDETGDRHIYEEV